MIEPLTDALLPTALAYLRRWPYRCALLASNLSQLRPRCDVLVAQRVGRIVGVASTYFDLPAPNLVFTAETGEIAAALIAALSTRNPGLLSQPTMALLPEPQFQQMQQLAALIDHELEYQMVVEPETLRVPTNHSARRLTQADLPTMSALAQAASLSVWHESALQFGPAFGCFVDQQLVSMAATHFATLEVIEIGHVATHPNQRGRGYAKAATAALAQAAFALAPRVYLMVLEQNTAARAAYRSLGFYSVERFHLARFQRR
ncbi:MAG: GNAT family N-acetyltransferase [Roseiflexaceae bacterium]|nr:GNAT family N-acetyltransferase [Roseiflexaceae bacterium]